MPHNNRYKTVRTQLAVISAALSLLTAQPARAQWEIVRQSEAASCLLENTAGGYQASYTIGEPSASLLKMAVSSSSNMLSGYLSQIPSKSLVLSVAVVQSSGAVGAVVSEGALFGADAGNPVKFVFSNEILPGVVAPGLNVSEVRNHLGVPVNSTQAASVTYIPNALIPDETAVSLNPAAGWKKGSIYGVLYSSTIADINGLMLLPGSTRYFTVKMDPLENNVAGALNDVRARVSIPPGAFPTDFFVIISTAQTSQEVEAANRRHSATPGAVYSALSVLSARSFDEAGAAVQPSSPCVISFPYVDENGDGIVDGSFPPVRAKNLAVWRLDEVKSLWVKQTGADIYEPEKEASFIVKHFSSYALMGVPDTEVSLVRAYPVPFSPNAGNSARYGNWTDLITFTDLPSYGKIRIYTITGDLVRALDVVPGDGEMKWDVRNSAGEIVASGVYIWEIISTTGRKTGKLMVVK